MHKYELLRQRAEVFYLALEKYAKQDDDIEWVLEMFTPWHKRIQQKEIRLPCHDYRIGSYFVNPDLSWWGGSSIADRYTYKTNGNHPLVRASVLLDEAMRDWLSDPVYLEQLRVRGEVPSAILDELPPPEEEVPLPEANKSVETKRWHQIVCGWFSGFWRGH